MQSHGYRGRHMTSLAFSVLNEHFSVVRLPPQAAPTWVSNTTSFTSMTRTADELSIVCTSPSVPEGIAAEHGWRCLKLQGPFAFDQVGVLASVAVPLAERKIGIFVLSTFDTDYILVKEHDLDAALSTLQNAGHRHMSGGT